MLSEAREIQVIDWEGREGYFTGCRGPERVKIDAPQSISYYKQAKWRSKNR